MIPTKILYLVLSFAAPHVDQVPVIKGYLTMEEACESAEHTIYPSTVWMEQVRDLEGTACGYFDSEDRKKYSTCNGFPTDVTLDKMACVKETETKVHYHLEKADK